MYRASVDQWKARLDEALTRYAAGLSLRLDLLPGAEQLLLTVTGDVWSDRRALSLEMVRLANFNELGYTVSKLANRVLRFERLVLEDRDF